MDQPSSPIAPDLGRVAPEAGGPAPARTGLRRHLSILPNVFTSLNLFCGYLSIIFTSQDEFLAAGWILVVAVICDILDGRIARLTSVTSKFGAELDSLADLVSFGVAPAFLVFRRYLSDVALVGLVCTGLFVLCGALRLARFNITPPSDKDVFTGLPIPAGAGILCTLTIFEMQFFPFFRIPDAAIPAIVVITSFLMVSTIEYPAMKKTKRTTGQRRLLVLLFLVFLLVFPPLCLFLISWGFAIYGPFMYLFRKMAGLFRRHKPEKIQPSV
ncbi:MAG: CDP-diacylglycerol--serine O-phosphatidyltransferase [Candidatus Ozemobacter sibiricus]|uniref:CDP-diacylglycerol--serine O-phosphatidyltransferase n=1 Tax=Candidatus Ozemobacter sibiricus TaxID=2268124 RepID=A0A367ZI93_9BACT|nr:MAG: CDP-diacylglycerol--serine O-phosphatidyltransferase [Candidatus Ozemobacter sibiricus]